MKVNGIHGKIFEHVEAIKHLTGEPSKVIIQRAWLEGRLALLREIIDGE